MSYNGSGTFVINSTGQPVVTGTVISSSVFNALTADLGTGLSTAITKDGQTTTTARVPFAAGINSSLTTDATSTTTGSIITAGGISTQKALFVGTTANIAGAATLSSTLGVAGVTTLTNTSAGAATTPLILRNASGTASTESVLQFNPSASTARYAEIASQNDGANTTSLIFRGGSGGTLTTGITVSGLGVVTLSSGATIAGDPIMTRGAAETITGGKTFSTTPILANNVPLDAKETGGTNRDVLRMNTSNVLVLGEGTNALSIAASTTTFTAAAILASTAPQLDFNDTNSTSNERYWRFSTSGSSFNLDLCNDAGSGQSNQLTITRVGSTSSSSTVNITGSVTIGAPTGGAMGNGTLNATAVYDDGTLLTCYIVEAWKYGAIDLAKWDALTPNREHPATYETVETGEVDADDKPVTEQRVVTEAYTEVREHAPARGFARVAADRLDIDKFAQFVWEQERLPAFPAPDRWSDMYAGKMATGDLVQRLWETVEVMAVHSIEARKRELALLARITALEAR